jgi:hypothetical protein
MAAFVIRGIMDEDFAYPQTPYFTDVPASHPQFKYILLVMTALAIP